MTGRGRILGFGGATVLVVAGAIVAVAVAGTVGQVLAFVLISLGLVLATALVFLEVGLSEDKERAKAAQEEMAGAGDAPRRARPSPPRARLRPPRMERMRGRRRRL